MEMALEMDALEVIVPTGTGEEPICMVTEGV